MSVEWAGFPYAFGSNGSDVGVVEFVAASALLLSAVVPLSFWQRRQAVGALAGFGVGISDHKGSLSWASTKIWL